MPSTLSAKTALRSGRNPLHRALLALGILLSPGMSPCLHAQDASSPGSSQPYTLHVYENLLQIPTLVLNGAKHEIPSLRPDQFNISLDSGPLFHPSHLRLQGDDPISLSVLLDLSRAEQIAFLQHADVALAAVSPELLNYGDQVTIYAADCVLARSINEVPASPYLLAQGTRNAMAYPKLHGHANKSGNCANKRTLWDEIAYVVQSLENAPGRRIVLVFSSGDDRHSKNTWGSIARFAAHYSISVFAIRNERSPALLLPGSPRLGPSIGPPTEDAIAMLCAATGGMDVDSNEQRLSPDLRHLLSLVHERYILEFPRPRNDLPGSHAIEVTVALKGASARPAGLSYAPADPALSNDPNTVHGDPNRAPQLGTRKPLTPQ